MALEYAILGFLNYAPMSGYDLKKQLDRSISHFWPAVQSQIYKTLARMEAAGWLSAATSQQSARPPRKIYALTEAGRAELMCWLSTAQPLAETRLVWLIQLFFAGALSDEHILGLLEQHRSLVAEKLASVTSIPHATQALMQNAPPRERFFWLLTVDYGIAQLRAQLAWLDAAILEVGGLKAEG